MEGGRSNYFVTILCLVQIQRREYICKYGRPRLPEASAYLPVSYASRVTFGPALVL